MKRKRFAQGTAKAIAATLPSAAVAFAVVTPAFNGDQGMQLTQEWENFDNVAGFLEKKLK